MVALISSLTLSTLIFTVLSWFAMASSASSCFTARSYVFTARSSIDMSTLIMASHTAAGGSIDLLADATLADVRRWVARGPRWSTR